MGSSAHDGNVDKVFTLKSVTRRLPRDLTSPWDEEHMELLRLLRVRHPVCHEQVVEGQGPQVQLYELLQEYLLLPLRRCREQSLAPVQWERAALETRHKLRRPEVLPVVEDRVNAHLREVFLVVVAQTRPSPPTDVSELTVVR